jgi:phage terminase large subunit-like protein
MKWSTACPDWEQRIVARESLIPSPPLFAVKAEDALGVFKSLQVVDLPQKKNGTFPTLGEVCDDFVFEFVAAIFGAEDPETGRRLISQFMLLISKKNGKSMIAAGIMLTALILNWRHHAELLILAPTIEVAGNSFGPAAGMVRADPELSELLHVIEHQRTIKHRVTGAELKIIAADSGVVSGKKAAFVLVEELWLFGKNPKAEAMLSEATGGLATRPEGFELYISTHSDEPPAGVFKSKLAYFRDVRDGVIEDPASLGVLYEWPEALIEAEAYLEPDNFYVTNPSLGRSVQVDFLTRKLAMAQTGDGDESLQVFLAKHLNVEIGMRLRRDRWAGVDIWPQNALPGLTLESLLARCEVAVVGIDGGGRDDLFGLGVVGREAGTGLWLAWGHAWAQLCALERRKAIAPMLQGFAADGNLTLCATGTELVEQVAALTVKVRDSGKMPATGGVGLDMASIGPLIDALVAAGFDPGDVATGRAGQIVPVRQGWGLTSAVYTTEFKLGDGMLLHDGSPMMSWCVSNARATLKGSNMLIDKGLSGAGKIDPLIALFNAIKLMEAGPVAADPAIVSPYATRGLVVI